MQSLLELKRRLHEEGTPQSEEEQSEVSADSNENQLPESEDVAEENTNTIAENPPPATDEVPADVQLTQNMLDTSIEVDTCPPTDAAPSDSVEPLLQAQLTTIEIVPEAPRMVDCPAPQTEVIIETAAVFAPPQPIATETERIVNEIPTVTDDVSALPNLPPDPQTRELSPAIAQNLSAIEQVYRGLASDPTAKLEFLHGMIDKLREWLAALPPKEREKAPNLRYRTGRRGPKPPLTALPAAPSPSPPSTLEELRSQLDTKEGRLLGLYCEHCDEEVSYSDAITLLWPGQAVSQKLKIQVRIIASTINNRLRQGEFRLGIIVPAADGHILTTEAPFALAKLDGIHSNAQREAVLYLGKRDRQIVPYAELHQQMFGKPMQDELDRRSVQKILRKIRDTGFTLVHTGKEENGCLMNRDTNIPHTMALESYDDYVLLALLLQENGQEVDRATMLNQLTKARWLLRTRTEVQLNSLHLAIGRLPAALGDRGTLTVNRGERATIVACMLQWKAELERPEPTPPVLPRSEVPKTDGKTDIHSS